MLCQCFEEGNSTVALRFRGPRQLRVVWGTGGVSEEIGGVIRHAVR